MLKPTQMEVRLFELLLGAVGGSPVRLRVAGGWVRDKILMRPTGTDVDIAVENATGAGFAHAVSEYLKNQAVEFKGFGVIRANPDKSKHLETATMQVLDFSLDFVGLRGEVYDEGSRIPRVVEGTVEQDAMRRDFTINSLFYNLHTREVEDWTKLGLSDLQKRLLRTPCHPAQTFHDDPLRVLRGLRFASRFGLEIEKETWLGMASQQVKGELAHKVSRERVGKEFLGSYKQWRMNQNVLLFLELANKLELIAPLLKLQEPAQIQLGMEFCRRMNPHFGFAVEELSKAEHGAIDEEGCGLAVHLALLLFPFYSPKAKEKNQTPFKACLEELKLPKKNCDFVLNLQNSIFQLSKILEHQNLQEKKAALALWQRETGKTWRSVALMRDATSNVGMANALVEFFQKENLSDFWNAEPLFDGNEIRKIFKVEGKQIAEKLSEMLKFQALFPNSTKEDFINYHNISK